MCAKAADGIKINLNWASKGKARLSRVRGSKSWEDALALDKCRGGEAGRAAVPNNN